MSVKKDVQDLYAETAKPDGEKLMGSEHMEGYAWRARRAS